MRLALANSLGAHRPPPVGGPLSGILAGLGLTSGLKLVLDAGDINSWPGSGQSWLDLSGNDYDFFLGADGNAGTSDPTFTGTAGGLSSGEYWAFDGGDYFTYDTTNETWMQNLHKDNAAFTVLAWFYPGSTGTQRLFGTYGAGASTGVYLTSTSGGQLQIVALNAGVTAYSFASGANGDIAPTVWNFVGISLDESVGASGARIYVRDKVTAGTSTYTSPASGNASQTFAIGSAGGVTLPILSGGRLAMFAAWDVALTQAQVNAVKSATRGRFGV